MRLPEKKRRVEEKRIRRRDEGTKKAADMLERDGGGKGFRYCEKKAGRKENLGFEPKKWSVELHSAHGHGGW